MKTEPKIDLAAALLADLRLRENGYDQPIDDLPTDYRPADLDQAYRIQQVLRAKLAQRGAGESVGWKIGCTTAVMQQYLHIDHPCAGTLYQHTVGRAQSVFTLYAESCFQLGLECELAVRLAADLPAISGGYDRRSVSAAVAAIMTSVEVVEHRFVDFSKASTASLVADDFFSAGCLLGAEHDPSTVGDLAALCGGFRIDGEAGPQGAGSAILGHPLNALVWLADHAAKQGTPLRAGDLITLGSVVKTIYPQAGNTIEAHFDGLSPVTINVR